MSAMAIKIAERHIMTHLKKGGNINDDIGSKLVTDFVVTVFQDNTITEICSQYGLSPEDLHLIITSSIIALMPNPCIKCGGNLLVTTLYFMEPMRLQEIAESILRTQKLESNTPRMAIIKNISSKVATLTWNNHVEQRGEASFRIKTSSSSSGCVVLIAFVIALLYLVF